VFVRSVQDLGRGVVAADRLGDGVAYALCGQPSSMPWMSGSCA
jgi:hypothetical protein